MDKHRGRTTILPPWQWVRGLPRRSAWRARFHEPLLWLQDQFLWLLVASYGIAAFWPEWGLTLKQVRLAAIGSTGVEVTFATTLLSWLLFSAGLGLSLFEVRTVVARPSLLVAGLSANVLVPVSYLGLLAVILLPWLANDERTTLLTGLAIVAAVPIASSSTAWCQNANGNLALSIGLLLFSTLLSPFTTPVILHLADHLDRARSTAVVRHLSPTYTVVFLFCFVLLPIVAGIAVRRMIGRPRVGPAQTPLKLINLGCLLLLNYSNAAISLPQVVAAPEEGFLVVITLATGGMCLLAFSAAGFIAHVLRADPSQRTALLFGMGMNNNGVGLVLASLALASDTRILLPIIVYNLWQHLIAGGVDHWVCRRQRHDPSAWDPGSRAAAASADADAGPQPAAEWKSAASPSPDAPPGQDGRAQKR